METARTVVPIRAVPVTGAPTDAATEESLYEVRRKIYPRAVHGWFAGWRWTMVWLTQLLFYGLPWFEWNGRQMVLFDLAARKFYIFGLVFWPQDFIYLTMLLICSAMALFLFTTIGGRLWCGYACPQTVYTEIFMWIERHVEGDRHARMRLDRAPASVAKFARKSLKHTLWISIALWTGLTFVGYFSPIRELVPDAVRISLGPWESFWILFYGFATYGNAGWMREQVCKYMCPYARFQSAMFDQDTLVITYDAARGDPRGSRSRKIDPKTVGLGDCVDCGVCVEVCPTGIDIRNGLQYECIGCAACIDGCDRIMDKMGYAPGLIRYTTEHALTRGWDKAMMWRRVLRPRVLIYSAILLTIVLATGLTLALRAPLKVDVIRDRGTLAREVEDGWIENVYRLQIMNQDEQPHRFLIRAEGLPGLRITAAQSDGNFVTDIPSATTHGVALAERIPPGQPGGSHRIAFSIHAEDRAGIQVREKAVFLVPR